MSREEKLLILQMVAEGKITPEQGVELLKAIGSGADSPKAPALPVPPIEVKIPRAEKVVKIRSGDAEIPSESDIETYVEGRVKSAVERAEQAAGSADRLASTVENIVEGIVKRMFGGGDGYSFEEERVGDLPDNEEIKVRISTSNGRIVLGTWSGQGYRLVAKKTVRASNEEEARELARNSFDLKLAGNVLEVTAKEKAVPLGLTRLTVSFELYLPESRKYDLQLDSANGRVVVNGIKGSSLSAHTANGRIEANGAEFGKAVLRSANGRIGLEGSFGELDAETANGRIEAALDGVGNWRFTSTNGRIEVKVSRLSDSGYDVDLSAANGRIEVSGITDVDVLLDETRKSYGTRRYKCRTKGFESMGKQSYLKASSSNGKIAVFF